MRSNSNEFFIIRVRVKSRDVLRKRWEGALTEHQSINFYSEDSNEMTAYRSQPETAT